MFDPFSADDMNLMVEAIDLKLNVLRREKRRWPQFSGEVLKKISHLTNISTKLKLLLREKKA